MTQNGGEKFSSEVNNRLSELFGETKPPGKAPRDVGRRPSPAPSENEPASPAAAGNGETIPDKFSPFTELKSIVLSIEWEITDKSMRRLIDETGALQKSFSNNTLILSFLKLLESVGKYIGSKKATAHPDSVSLLHSVYKQLEQVMMSSVMSEAEVKAILAAEVKKFKALRQKLLDRSAQPAQPEVEPQERQAAEAMAQEKTEATVSDAETCPDLDILAEKIDLIERRIQEEINELRKLLNTFRK